MVLLERGGGAAPPRRTCGKSGGWEREGTKVGCTGEWFDLDAGEMVFVFLLSCSYKVLGELKANKINWY